MECTHCYAGVYEKQKVIYSFLGENIGIFNALVCQNCRETLFESDASDKIESKVKNLGLFGRRLLS